MAQRPSSQKTTAGSEPRTFDTFVPQAGALTNRATSYSICESDTFGKLPAMLECDVQLLGPHVIHSWFSSQVYCI